MGGSLFDHVTRDMTIYKTEIFGPVLSVVRAKSYDEAVDLINTHEYGNGTAIFTRDGDVARNFADSIEVGMVASTCRSRFRSPNHSFGAGSARCSAITPSTAPRACASSRAIKT